MCNCKKKKEEPVVPQTPEELHAIEITNWAGGMTIEIKTPNTDEESNNERPA
jgi:hypothetical protein